MSRLPDEGAEYLCPGQQKPVGRAIHLARLAGHYPGCRQCEHRHATGSLSTRQRSRLSEASKKAVRPPLFGEEYAGGVVHNDLDALSAGKLAAALGVSVRAGHAAAEGPRVVLGSDGRAILAELVAAAAEGLRWAGCRVLDIGPATTGLVEFAQAEAAAGGALLVGNPPGRAHTAGLGFWGPGGSPASAGGTLDSIRRHYETHLDRPGRRYADLARLEVRSAYLASLAAAYHGLRPLRFVLDTPSGPFADLLERLTGPTACQVLRREALPGRIGKQVVAEQAHFGVCVDEDGRRLRIWNERGRPVEPHRLLRLLVDPVDGESAARSVVVEEGVPQRTADAIRALGSKVVVCRARCQEVHAAVDREKALLGGGVSGRWWFGLPRGRVSGDAMWALTRLLGKLSATDRPASEVLGTAGDDG